MSVSFVKKYYTCSACGETGSKLLCIKNNTELSISYPESGKPAELKEGGIYIETLERDEYGIVTKRIAEEYPCEKCFEFALVENKKDNDNNVLNFYPKTEAHKWLDGLGKAGL